MKFGPVPLNEAAGKILAHNVIGSDGRRRFSKGHILTGDDLAALRELRYDSVIVAALDATDLGENEAARRVGTALCGPGLRAVAPGVGRANLMATVRGPLHVNVSALEHINSVEEGITIATLPRHTLVEVGQLVALVKIIPFGVPAARVVDVETVATSVSPTLSVNPLRPGTAALIVSGPERARQKLLDEFCAPVQKRIEFLGSTLSTVSYVSHTSSALAAAIREQYEASHSLILLAGVSAIIDRTDVAPQALLEAGGTITQFGVPVDPGSLLMLGYIGDTPVVGAPGCIKSLKTNIIDWILPRLLAGERLTRADLITMGHGGLLEDISERPMPREQT